MPNFGGYGQSGAEAVAYQPGGDTIAAHARYYEFQMRQIHGPNWQPDPQTDPKDYKQKYLDALAAKEGEKDKEKDKGKSGGGFMKRAAKGFGKVLNGGAGRAYDGDGGSGKGKEEEAIIR